MDGYLANFDRVTKRDPVPCALMLFGSSAWIRSAWEGHVQRVHDGVPRVTLLGLLSILQVLPLVILWAAGFCSLLRQDHLRYWVLGGLLFSLSIPQALSLVMQGHFMSISLDTAHVFGHGGVVLGAAMSTSWLARRFFLESAQHDTTDAADAETKLEGGRGVSAQSDTDPTAKCDDERQDVPAEASGASLTLANISGLVWVALFNCTCIVMDSYPAFLNPFASPASRSVVDSAVMHVLGLYAYGKLVWDYSREHRYSALDCGCGLLVGLASLALLRLSTSDVSWRSWKVDGALAFVAANAGLLFGWYARKRLVL